MNLAIKFFCCLLVLGLAGLFVLKQPDGTPWLSLNDFAPDLSKVATSVEGLINTLTPDTSSTNSDADTQNGIYRWKDANGQWQFSDTAPSGLQAETVELSGELNRDLVEQYTPPEPITRTNTAEPNPSNTNNSVIPATLSPEKISELIKDANNVQQLMDDRATKIDQYTR